MRHWPEGLIRYWRYRAELSDEAHGCVRVALGEPYGRIAFIDDAAALARRDLDAWRERALRAEALVRAKDETIGELLEDLYAIDWAYRRLDKALRSW